MSPTPPPVLSCWQTGSLFWRGDRGRWRPGPAATRRSTASRSTPSVWCSLSSSSASVSSSSCASNSARGTFLSPSCDQSVISICISTLYDPAKYELQNCARKHPGQPTYCLPVIINCFVKFVLIREYSFRIILIVNILTFIQSFISSNIQNEEKRNQ